MERASGSFFVSFLSKLRREREKVSLFEMNLGEIVGHDPCDQMEGKFGMSSRLKFY